MCSIDLTHLSLFTGIGGIDLAAEWAGFNTVGQVEQNPYAVRILRKRFGRRLPRWGDIRDLSAADFKRRTGIDSPTLISGGFPCQPFSVAGTRRGTADDRYLWPEMFRIVRELRPSWVIGENVTGIVSMELEHCCSDLEGEGYTVRSFLIPACGVGACHRRERVFIVAHSSGVRYLYGEPKQWEIQDRVQRGEVGAQAVGISIITNPHCSRTSPGRTDRRMGGIRKPVQDVAYSKGTGLEGANTKRDTRSERCPSKYGQGGWETDWWDAEPAVGRVAHGVPHRVDRLRGLGNAVVPQQIYPILAGIAQIEQEALT